MRALKILSSMVFMIIVLPLQFFSTFLLYQHVHATDLMWFLWWFTIPFIVIVQIIFKIAEMTGEKK